MLIVHHLNNSRSQRVLWLLEELGVPYEIVRYQRQPDMRAPAQLRAIHPLGKSPVITDNGNTIAESGAIAEYILDTYGEGAADPAAKDAGAAALQPIGCTTPEGSAMPPLLLKLLFTLMPKRAPALLRPLVRKVSNQALTTLVNPQLKQHMAFWEGELGKSQWFAGDQFTAADIQMSFSTGSGGCARRAGTGSSQSDGRFWSAFTPRPAYNRALEKGGPYTVEGRGHCSSSLRGAKRRSNPFFLGWSFLDCFAEPVIGAHSRDPLARNDALIAPPRSLP